MTSETVMKKEIFVSDDRCLVPVERLIVRSWQPDNDHMAFELTPLGYFMRKQGFQVLDTGYIDDNGVECCMVFSLD